jgi:hypothetical protein
MLAAARPESRSFAPMAAVSGEAAVARAEVARRSREVANIAQMDAAQALATERLALPPAAMLDMNSKGADGAGRTIAGRRFTLRDGVWEDAGHTEKHGVVEIAAWSDAHFAILRTLPEAALVLREMESVLIAGRVVSLRFGEKGVKSMSEAELRRLVADFR